MTDHRPTVEPVPTARVPDQLPLAIIRPRQLVEAVLAQSLLEIGDQGRAALAWDWALTGARPSPVTLSLPIGQPPTQAEILAEASAPPEGSTAPPGVPADYCDQLAEGRHILAWLAGDTDEIPLDDDNRGRFTGTRDDYARTDAVIRRVRDQTRYKIAILRPARPHGPRRRHEPLALESRLDERRLAPRRPRPPGLGHRRPPRLTAIRARRQAAHRVRPQLRRSSRRRCRPPRPPRRNAGRPRSASSTPIRRGPPRRH